MDKRTENIILKQRKRKIRVGICFLLLSLMMIGVYFEIGRIEKIILGFNIFLFLIISIYLIFDNKTLSEIAKFILKPFYKIFKKKNTVLDENSKRRIYYSRTHRHLNPNFLRMSLFFIFFVVPSLILYIWSYSDLSALVMKIASMLTSRYIDPSTIGLSSGEFLPKFGDVYFLTVDSYLPSTTQSLTHVVVTILLMFIVKYTLNSQMHMKIYILVALGIHLSSAIFMLFFVELFPYSLVDYSEIYMKQQIGIWLSIFSIVTLLSGSINYTGISKFVFVILASIYSFIFGVVRYCVFIGLMHHFSLIFMASFFFSFGPFIDFLYLVWMYSIFMRHITVRFNNKRGIVKWYWA